jgi:hypothetical protein
MNHNQPLDLGQQLRGYAVGAADAAGSWFPASSISMSAGPAGQPQLAGIDARAIEATAHALGTAQALVEENQEMVL